MSRIAIWQLRVCQEITSSEFLASLAGFKATRQVIGPAGPAAQALGSPPWGELNIAWGIVDFPWGKLNSAWGMVNFPWGKPNSAWGIVNFPWGKPNSVWGVVSYHCVGGSVRLKIGTA